MNVKINYQQTEISTDLNKKPHQHDVVTKTNTYRRDAIIIGGLFIIATVASSLGFLILDPFLNELETLVNLAANITQVTIAILLLLINCAAVAAIPVILFPILKKHSETCAVGYLGSRIIESVILIVGAISLLSLSTLSQDFVKNSVQDTSASVSYFQTSGALLLTVYDWSILIGIMIVFGITALILNSVFYQSKLIPRWLSGWGFIGALLLLVSGLFELFGFHPSEFLSMPIALQEMVFAVWLIIKGFNPQALISESENQKLAEGEKRYLPKLIINQQNNPNTFITHKTDIKQL